MYGDQKNERTNEQQKIRIIKSPNTQMTMMTDADNWMNVPKAEN